jgi:prepilin-type N-terminal cleavage/methylation domain-containing protein/prepilin-type processing-associated H-X9-DG protein
MVRRAFTLVELLVVIAIISVLIAIALPAVQAVRGAAQAFVCKNHLRQIGLALDSFHTTFRRYPSNGWGYQWHGVASVGSYPEQPGGWIFQILPQIEMQNVRYADVGVISQTPIELFHCPTRRASQAYPYTETFYPLFNCTTGDMGAKSDYAICGGDHVIDGSPGPATPEDFDTYSWPDYTKATGIAFVIMRVRHAHVRDGLSHTLLVGEKALNIAHYMNGQSQGDDQTMYIGDDADNRRWAHIPPLYDSFDGIDPIQEFGGPHSSGCHFVFADGSVHSMAFVVDDKAFANMGNRNDGNIVSLD